MWFNSCPYSSPQGRYSLAVVHFLELSFLLLLFLCSTFKEANKQNNAGRRLHQLSIPPPPPLLLFVFLAGSIFFRITLLLNDTVSPPLPPPTHTVCSSVTATGQSAGRALCVPVMQGTENGSDRTKALQRPLLPGGCKCSLWEVDASGPGISAAATLTSKPPPASPSLTLTHPHPCPPSPSSTSTLAADWDSGAGGGGGDPVPVQTTVTDVGAPVFLYKCILIVTL